MKMKKMVIILSVVASVLLLYIAGDALLNMAFEMKLINAAENINSTTVNQRYNSIEELREGWPTRPLEDDEISPEFAMQIGITYLKYEFNSIKNTNIYDQIFSTKYFLEESKDGTYYIVTILPKDRADYNVAIDKKSGGMLHLWLGE